MRIVKNWDVECHEFYKIYDQTGSIGLESDDSVLLLHIVGTMPLSNHINMTFSHLLNSLTTLTSEVLPS